MSTIFLITLFTQLIISISSTDWLTPEITKKCPIPEIEKNGIADSLEQDINTLFSLDIEDTLHYLDAIIPSDEEKPSFYNHIIEFHKLLTSEAYLEMVDFMERIKPCKKEPEGSCIPCQQKEKPTFQGTCSKAEILKEKLETLGQIRFETCNKYLEIPNVPWPQLIHEACKFQKQMEPLYIGTGVDIVYGREIDLFQRKLQELMTTCTQEN